MTVIVLKWSRDRSRLADIMPGHQKFSEIFSEIFHEDTTSKSETIFSAQIKWSIIWILYKSQFEFMDLWTARTRTVLTVLRNLRQTNRKTLENVPPQVTHWPARLSVRWSLLKIWRLSLFEFILFWLPGAILKLNLPNFLNFLPKALCLCKWVAVVKCVGGNDSILAKIVSCIMIHHT